MYSSFIVNCEDYFIDTHVSLFAARNFLNIILLLYPTYVSLGKCKVKELCLSY